MNKVFLVGNCGKEPKATQTPKGLLIVKTSLCTNKRTKNGDKWEDKPTWHNITAFGKSAEKLRNAKAGDKLFIEGEINTSSYEKNGEKKYITEILANQIEFLASMAAGNQPQQQQEMLDQFGFDDEVPF